jgi:hypothetical protein
MHARQTRTLDLISLHNEAGVVVRANSTSVQSALSNYLAANSNPAYSGIVLSTVSAALLTSRRRRRTLAHTLCPHLARSRGAGAGVESWPLATFGSFFYRSKTMEDCNKAAALASFLYYSQTDPEAKSIADRYDYRVRAVLAAE